MPPQLHLKLTHSQVEWFPVPVLSFAVLLVADDANLLVPHVVDTGHSSRVVDSAVARGIDPLPLIVALGVCFPSDCADRAAQQATSVGDEDLAANLVEDTVDRRPGPDQEPLSFVHYAAIERIRRGEVSRGGIVVRGLCEAGDFNRDDIRTAHLLGFGQIDLVRQRGIFGPYQAAYVFTINKR